jgi:hypothetical protein
MPDRDLFTKLKPQYRLAAQTLMRALKEEAFDVLPVAVALDKSLDGGIPSLPWMKQGLMVLRGPERQRSFEDDSFREIGCHVLRKQSEEKRGGWKDDLLCKETIKEWNEKGAASDGPCALRRVAVGILSHEIIEAEGGVAQQLRREGLAYDTTMSKKVLGTKLAPLLDAFAETLWRRPEFGQTRLASQFRRPVDLHGENLLSPGGAP